MNSQEIIDKYKEKIEEQIQNYFKRHDIMDKREIEEFTENYKKRFVQGFYEGIEETKIETALEMIKANCSIELIQQVTKLPLSKIETLKQELLND